MGPGERLWEILPAWAGRDSRAGVWQREREEGQTEAACRPSRRELDRRGWKPREDGEAIRWQDSRPGRRLPQALGGRTKSAHCQAWGGAEAFGDTMLSNLGTRSLRRARSGREAGKEVSTCRGVIFYLHHLIPPMYTHNLQPARRVPRSFILGTCTQGFFNCVPSGGEKEAGCRR